MRRTEPKAVPDQLFMPLSFRKGAAHRQTRRLLRCHAHPSPSRSSSHYFAQSDIRSSVWTVGLTLWRRARPRIRLVDPERLAAVMVEGPSLARIRQDVSHSAAGPLVMWLLFSFAYSFLLTNYLIPCVASCHGADANSNGGEVTQAKSMVLTQGW